MTKNKAEVWGPVIASLLAGAGEVTRAAIAARLRSTAAELERGDIVSDDLGCVVRIMAGNNAPDAGCFRHIGVPFSVNLAVLGRYKGFSVRCP